MLGKRETDDSSIWDDIYEKMFECCRKKRGGHLESDDDTYKRSVRYTTLLMIDTSLPDGSLSEHFIELDKRGDIRGRTNSEERGFYTTENNNGEDSNRNEETREDKELTFSFLKERRVITESEIVDDSRISTIKKDEGNEEIKEISSRIDTRDLYNNQRSAKKKIKRNEKDTKKTEPEVKKDDYFDPRACNLDVDAYLASVESGKFYIVRHKERSLFVKFSEVYLPTEQKKYQKGKNSKVPASLSPEVRKYYPKRYVLFEKFDEGIELDTVGWFSVTPESVARYTAQRLPYERIVDFFSGVGGNSIQVNSIDISSLSMGHSWLAWRLTVRGIGSQ